jgi:hypothetical protein
MSIDGISAGGLEFLSQAIERRAACAQEFDAPPVRMVADRTAWAFFTQT